jgi:hypothetical protein
LDTFAEEFVRVPALMSSPDFSRNLARQSARRAAGAAVKLRKRGSCDASSDAFAASSRRQIEEAEKDQQ